MRIKWLGKVTSACNMNELFLVKSDLNAIYLQDGCIRSLNDHLQDNNSSFTKEELLFLNELIESKDKDNLIIAFTIIDGK